MGFSEESKGYRVWLPDERAVVVSRDVRFSTCLFNKINEFQDFAPDTHDREVSDRGTEDHDYVEVALDSPANEHPVETETGDLRLDT